MEKKFDHAVIFNGVIIPANTVIKVEEPKPAEEKPKKAKAKDGVK